MLTAHQISKSYNLKQILQDVTFSINEGERVGLIGPNGCGKTTLLRILTGEEIPDSGHIDLTPSNLRIGYLAQGLNPSPNETVKLLLQKASNDPEYLEGELIRVWSALGKKPDDTKLQEIYNQILNRMQIQSPKGQLASILGALGIDNLPKEQMVETLSGGQKTRLALAQVLLSTPQLLLLDEPTNHLDITMLEWLEDWLIRFPGAALIVSHDREFLEHTVSRILDINPQNHSIKSYVGSYGDYKEAIRLEHEKRMQEYNDQVAEIHRLRQDITRTRAQAERTEREASSIRIGGEKMKIKGYKDYQQGIAKKVAKKAKSRKKKLDRYLASDERVTKPIEGWQVKLEFDQPAHLGKQVLNIENLTLGYPGHKILLQDITLQVQSNQRIAFTGPNGSGKTTLLRAMSGKLLPLKGQIKLGSTVKLGYMTQEQENLDPHKNAVEIIQSVSALNHTETRNFLHYYLFRGDDPLRPVNQLSFGERSRLMLARLVALGCNFLILDEPINHLDIPSREQFERALSHFDGTVLAVVHDRYFIERFASEIWTIQEGKILRKIVRIV